MCVCVRVFQLLNVSITEAKALFEDVGQIRCNILNTQYGETTTVYINIFIFIIVYFYV